MELRTRKKTDFEPLDLPASAGQRRDPKVRARMSVPARRTFCRLAAVWALDNEEQRALLGLPPESTFYKHKAGHVGTLPYDTLMRVSLLLGICKDLNILYPEQDLANRWLKLSNRNPLFGGRPAMALMTESGMGSL